ncbi:L-idonate 5-dehydrogenase [Microbacterium sp. BE35]|nr:L-idonate 5-dehydrogenase [Microbacterium sp. BE35]
MTAAHQQEGGAMKALAIHGKEDIRWEDRPLPEPGEGEVRLRVRFVGICGSDLHYYFHGVNGEYAITEPLIPGHELSAVVDLDPSGRLEPGTPVTVHPARYGAPVPGLEDHPHLRPGGDYFGSAATTPHRQGGAAEYLVVEEHMIRVLPETLPLERAALAEPLAVALHAVNLAGDITGKRVLVIGAGPIGLLVVAAAAHAGAAVIGASDVRTEPLARAAALGASELVLVGRDTIADESYDVVFECSGVAVSLTQSVRAARRTGTIVQVGMLANAEIGVNLAPMLAKELTLRGAFRFSTEIDDAVAMLAESHALDAVVSHTIEASRAVEAFTVARDSSASAKVLLEL